MKLIHHLDLSPQRSSTPYRITITWRPRLNGAEVVYPADLPVGEIVEALTEIAEIIKRDHQAGH